MDNVNCNFVGQCDNKSENQIINKSICYDCPYNDTLKPTHTKKSED